MASTSTLIVAGYADQSVDREKIEKLLLLGLINSLGEEAPGLDAEFGKLSLAASSSPVHNEFGNCISNANSTATKHLIRLQFHPTAEQFRAALREAFAFALNTGRVSESEPSIGGRVHVVYTGQVVSSTGEWLLDGSSVSGHQIHTWLDSETAMSWWPQLNKYPNVGDKLSVHLVTPIAGPGSCWTLNKPGQSHTILTHVDVRLVKLDLHVEASWRFGGKPIASNPANFESYDGIRNFAHQTIQHLPLITLDLTSEVPPLGCALSAQRPALYVFPGSGLGSQGCGLFSLQGFTMLLGGAYTASAAPNWWRMVRNLPRLDVVLLPDWSAANLLTYRFMTDLPESHIIGELLLPPTASSATTGEVTGDLVLAPPTSAQSNLSHSPWASSSLASENLPQSTVLYSKLGWGELRLQPLAQRSGLVLLWKSVSHQQNSGIHSAPLRIVLPSTQLHGASPAQGLSRFVKSLSTVDALEGVVGTGKLSVGTAKTGKPMVRPPSSQPSTRVNGPVQTKPSGPPTRPQTAPRSARPAAAQQSATRKPAALASTTVKRPLSATTGSTNAAAPKRPASGTATTKDSTTRSKPSSIAPTTSKPQSTAAPARPSPPNKVSTRPISAAKPSGTTKTQPPKAKPSTTADRLAAHANLVASKQATGTRPLSAGMAKAKPTTLSKKQVAPGDKTATTKAKSPIREVSEPKSPMKANEEHKPPIEPPAQVITPATNNVLQESTEFAAVDPLMSGWQSMEQSLVSGVPISTIPNQLQELQSQEEVEEKSFHQQVDQNITSGEVDNSVLIDPFAHEESQITQPQDLYKVHKFERFNEADETELVDEVRTPSSMDQEPEDVVHDHTTSVPEQSLSPVQTDSVAQAVTPDHGKIMDEEEDIKETKAPYENKTERFGSIAADEETTDLIKSQIPEDKSFPSQDSSYENGQPNGMMTASSRPPAHLGFEDEEEFEAEGIPIAECELQKAQSPLSSPNVHPEFKEVVAADHMGVAHDVDEILTPHEPNEQVALTPGLTDFVQESTELSDTGSFERHEEEVVAAVPESGYPLEHVSASDQKDYVVPAMRDELNMVSEGNLGSHESQQMVTSQELTPATQDEPLSDEVEQVKGQLEDGITHQPEAFNPTYLGESDELTARDNMSFVTSELHPASMGYSQPEVVSERTHSQASMEEATDQPSCEGDLEQFMHKVVSETEQPDEPIFHSDEHNVSERYDIHMQHQQKMQPSFDLSRHMDDQMGDYDSHQTQEQDQQQMEFQSHSIYNASPTEELSANLASSEKIEEQAISTEKEVVSGDDTISHEQWMSNEPRHFVDTAHEKPLFTNEPQSNEIHSMGTDLSPAPVDVNGSVQPEPEDLAQVPGPQGDVAHSEEEHVSFEPDLIANKMPEPAHVLDQPLTTDSSQIPDEGAEVESKLGQSWVILSNNQDVRDSSHTIVSGIHGVPPNLSAQTEEVSSTQPPVTSHSPVSSQEVEDDQSIEVQMRLKMLHEGEWCASSGLHHDQNEPATQYYDEQVGVGKVQQSSDISDVEDNETELWITNKNTVTYHAAESPVSPSVHDVPTKDEDIHSPMEQCMTERTACDPDPQTNQGDLITEPTNQVDLDRPHSLITGSADSLEQIEPTYSTQFSTPPGVVADSTTTTSGQALPTSTQVMDKEPMTGSEIEHNYEVLRESIPDSLEESDEVHPALSTVADSTTADVTDHHELPISDAQVPLGFDQYMYRSDEAGETEQYAIQPPGSPESHSSMDSVVRQQQPQSTRDEEEAPFHLTDHTVHEQMKEKDSELPLHQHQAAYPFEATDDDTHDQQFYGSNDVHTTSNDHTSHELHEEVEHAECDHSVEVVSTETNQKDIGFVGYGCNMSENGTGHEFMHQLSDENNVKLNNGVQSSDLPDSLHLISPSEMQDHSHENSHGHQPYPYEQGGAMNSSEVVSPDVCRKIMPGLPTEFEEHTPWNPTGEMWPHNTGISQDTLHSEEVDLSARGMPYPAHGGDFLAHPTGTNPFELPAEFGIPPQVPARQPSQPGHSPIVSPQTEVFDPLQGWGQPQGLPTPTLPATTPRGMRTNNPPTRPAPPSRTSSALATATRGKATSGPAAPSTLPPGPPVYMDLIWVPDYLVRVPHSMAVEFFTRIRARTYVLSGDALHPMVGEAMIEGKAKWNPNDVELLRKQTGSDDEDNAICILPTDEPYEWGCWLRTPCGQVNRDTGESRLQASGFKVLPSASCCDIEFSAGSVDLRCEGVRVEF